MCPSPLVHTDDITRTVYATDNSIYQVLPDAVALPTDTNQVQRLLADNAALDRPLAVGARGAGTGTNGQSLTPGLAVDLKRHMHRIISIDPDALVAVVEPGAVAGELNAALAPHGLHWAPHTSTLNRCTVGGMIATDAAGKGSLVHGRTHRHVLALDVVLADGTLWRAEPLTTVEAEARAAGSGSGAALWRRLLDLPIRESDTFELPELARGFSGYGIDRFRRDGVIDPLALLVGSEGTLGVVTAATLRLTPLAAHTTLVVASYPSFAAALDDAVELRATQPSAIETFDERTLDIGRSSPAWPALGSVVGEHRGSVLLLEYSGDDVPDLSPVEAALASNGRSLGWATLDDPADRADAWKVRADAVGLLAKIEVGDDGLSARPTAMVEDCAVPVVNMAAFIADFRRVLDDFGVEYGMFGHADVGCVHVRPALDTTDPGHEILVRDITDRVVEVVARHGGILWGEHGRGFRGESAEAFLTAPTIELMRHVKTAFDPRDLLNPGKLYRPLGSGEPLIALDGPPLRGHANRAVPVEVRRSYSHAFACNGNGLCHHHGVDDVMCPSYTATRDPALSPKGRADLLREWLRREERGGDSLFAEGVASNLAQCLSCSACTGQCPVEVDIPELKSRFLERYYEQGKRPVAHRFLRRFESMAPMAGRLSGLTRWAMGPVSRAMGLIDLPSPRRPARVPCPTFRAGSTSGVDVVVLRDVFTSVLEPDTLRRSVELLQQCGYSVAVAELVPSGKFDHVKGQRQQFATAVSRQRALVEAIAAAGAVAAAIEPATALLHRHEYVGVDPDYPSTVVVPLAELLAERSVELPARRGPVTLFGHCTEQATGADSLDAWVRVLTAVGYDVTAPAVGCCGMAGIFGHERSNQDLSRAIWSLSWEPKVVVGATQAATGYSCRSQAKRLGAASLPHPLELL